MSVHRNQIAPTPGSLWREKRTGRMVVILKEEVHNTGPSWRYVDEPDGWYYSDAFDFIIWGEFEYVG